MPTPQTEPEDSPTPSSCCCGPLSYTYSALTRPVEVGDYDRGFGATATGDGNAFFTWPFLGPLLFENESSDARDHCANERTFLSYLRLSVYMAIIAIAIVLSFHLKSQPSAVELRMAKPLGIVFWLLSVACLVAGFGNYIKTVNGYSRREAIVQTGWRTQSIMSLIALAIVGTCVILLVITKVQSNT
ncbi:Uu.00g018140.m01.CDS01 [Anthostomella pinea]|uniref:Uu.00g018140.m01.CDS01 n=1 Tax=Anthostomella pinea TaxID=933095 RepID=A0AAI8VZX4_9PEZI|nr:Uu.00g018140.m01.CDS01 [Anthostomella pinea]